MRIDAVTTCVGEEYANHLLRSLPLWLDAVDSVTVVTNTDNKLLPSFYSCIYEGGRYGYSVLTINRTEAFTAGDASFNKGAALNNGFAVHMRDDLPNPRGWLLAFDCDILPPYNWRDTIEPLLQPGYLYSARRFKDCKPEDRRFYPRGYFQLWHVSDPNYRRSPIFDDHHQHAGRYDTAFAKQWPKDRWMELPIRLEHLGTKSTNWFGPGTTREQMKGALREAALTR